MKKYFARLMKAVVVSALGIGGGVGLLVMICIVTLHNKPNAFEFAWQKGLELGLVVAFLWSIVLILLDISSRLYLAKGLYTNVWELEQKREVRMHGSSKDVLAACRKALLSVANVESVFDDAENLLTRAKTGSGLRSPGEQLEVEINPVSENHWTATCVSKPESKGVVFDYGKNFENVETWLAVVQQTESFKKAREETELEESKGVQAQEESDKTSSLSSNSESKSIPDADTPANDTTSD